MQGRAELGDSGPWCGGVAGASWEDSWGGADLVFSQIPVLLETCAPPGVRILQAGRAGAPAACFLSCAGCRVSRSPGK